MWGSRVGAFWFRIAGLCFRLSSTGSVLTLGFNKGLGILGEKCAVLKAFRVYEQTRCLRTIHARIFAVA